MDYSLKYKELTTECGKAKLMAVSKTRTLEEIESAYNGGFKLFGENHVQEIVEKFSKWHPADIKVHMIGHLQSNKVSKVVPIVDMIQSVDSFELLKKIDSCAQKNNKIMPVLLEFNTSDESSKSGFLSEDELFSCIAKSLDLHNVEIKGLMTVGPLDHTKAHNSFARLRDLSIKCKQMFPQVQFSELSMGMSQDYKIAVDEGSTLVRIGTLIFGERQYV